MSQCCAITFLVLFMVPGNVRMTSRVLGSLKNKAGTETFSVTHDVAPVWRNIGKTLGIEKSDLDVVANQLFEFDDQRLEMVWSMWFNKELPNKEKYPHSWKGLRKLLEDSGKGTVATDCFEFLKKF